MSIGILPENYTVETLLCKHTSKPRNPKIANVFFKAGFIESWGRGYEKIMTAFEKAHLLYPTFLEEQGGVAVNIPREIFMSVRGAKDGAKDGANLTARQVEIISLIKNYPAISLDEIAVELGVGSRTVDREIKKLRHIVRRVGARNGGYWEVIQ